MVRISIEHLFLLTICAAAFGYAQWPSDEVRLAAFAEDLDPDASEYMSTAIAERFPELHLESVADYLEPLAIRAG